MKSSLFFAYAVAAVLLLSGCWVQEAPREKQHALSVLADHLTRQDSTILTRFAKKHHVQVQIQVLQPENLRQRIQQQRYNAAVDILLIEDGKLRNELLRLKAFAPIADKTLFGQLDRQFANKHHLWVPVAHDPLVVTTGKDSTGNCLGMRSWRSAGNAQPIVAIGSKHKEEYANALRRTKQLHWINLQQQPTLRTDRIYALSELVEKTARKDSTALKTGSCLFYLVDNKRYVSRMTTISLFAYARNREMADTFLQYFLAHAYNVADGRNQLPAKKNVKPNWRIRSLVIR